MKEQAEEIKRLQAENKRLKAMLDELGVSPDYVQSRIDEADQYRDRYAHMALNCDRLDKEVERLRKELGIQHGFLELSEQEVERLNNEIAALRDRLPEEAPTMSDDDQGQQPPVYERVDLYTEFPWISVGELAGRKVLLAIQRLVEDAYGEVYRIKETDDE